MVATASAHRDGCHAQHSCEPDDDKAYVCGDTGSCQECLNNQYCLEGRSRGEQPASAAEPQQPTEEPAERKQPADVTDGQDGAGAQAAETDEIGNFFGKVRSVTDGDSIVVEDEDRHRNRVRLAGIDAPEKGGKEKYGQPFSQSSRRHLSQLVYRKTVRVDWHTYDGFGRVVGRVWLDDVDVGLAQVCDGYAWVYRDFVAELSPEEVHAYLHCEHEARKERRGLWRDSRPVPPWEWRHSGRGKELAP